MASYTRKHHTLTNTHTNTHTNTTHTHKHTHTQTNTTHTNSQTPHTHSRRRGLKVMPRHARNFNQIDREIISEKSNLDFLD